MKPEILSMEELDRISQQNIKSMNIPPAVIIFCCLWIAFWFAVGAIL